MQVLEQASSTYKVFHSEMRETKASDWHLKLNFHLNIFFLCINWQGTFDLCPLNFTVKDPVGM